jgi:FtsZ-interacting cell division protein ZipA
MKFKGLEILIIVLALLVGILLFMLFSGRKDKGSQSHKNEIALRDSLIAEYRRQLKRDSAELLKRDEVIKDRDSNITALKAARQGSQVKQQIVKKKSEEIKKHIDSDNYTADSLRRAFAEFE